MEKDYFKDRPIQCKQGDALKIGNEAYICLKEMQKSATNIKDLTRIEITQHLTKHDEHPRGIKLQGLNYRRNDFGILLADDDGLPIVEKCVGRCTYLINNDETILTIEGNKQIVKDSEGNWDLKLVDSLKDYYVIRGVFNIKNSDIAFEFSLDNYSFFKTIEDAEKNIENFKLCKFKFELGCILGYLNDEHILIKKYDVVLKNKYINITTTELLNFFKNKYKKSTFELEFTGFFACKYNDLLNTEGFPDTN